MNIVCNWQMPVLGDLNEKAISLEEVGNVSRKVVWQCWNG